MATRPRELSHHRAGQVRSARDLRRQAVQITEDIDSMTDLLLVQAARYGWDARQVVEGLDIAHALEVKRDALIAEAKQLECFGMSV